MYTYLPLGLAAIRKVEQIVREEMNRAGAIELHMPMVTPADLWIESGRETHLVVVAEHVARPAPRWHRRLDRRYMLRDCLGGPRCVYQREVEGHVQLIELGSQNGVWVKKPTRRSGRAFATIPGTRASW